jgi:hypothetical protein
LLGVMVGLRSESGGCMAFRRSMACNQLQVFEGLRTERDLLGRN